MDPCTCSAAERARDLSTPGQSVDIYVKQRQLLASIQTGSPFLGLYKWYFRTLENTMYLSIQKLKMYENV